MEFLEKRQMTLTQFIVDGKYVTPQTLKKLTLCKNLEELDVKGYPPKDLMASVSNFHNLKILTLNAVNTDGFNSLFSGNNFEHLTELNIDAHPNDNPSDTQIEHCLNSKISKFPNLKKLTLSRTPQLSNPDFKAKYYLKTIALACPMLESIKIYQYKKGSGLIYLSKLNNLKYLHFNPSCSVLGNRDDDEQRDILELRDELTELLNTANSNLLGMLITKKLVTII